MQFWIEPKIFAKTQYLIEGSPGEICGFFIKAIPFTHKA